MAYGLQAKLHAMVLTESNRLGANSTSECLVWGRITGELSEICIKVQNNSDSSSSSLSISQQASRKGRKREYTTEIFRGNGRLNPYEVRKELTDTMEAKAHIFRTEQDLIDGLKQVRDIKESSWKRVMIK